MSNNGFLRGGASGSQSVMINLIILNVVVYLIQSLLAPRLGLEPGWIEYHFGLHSLGGPGSESEFRIYQLLTYMFLHGSGEHLFFNMFTLWMFGRILEYDLGNRRFLVFYLICGIGAGVCSLGANAIMGNYYALTVGASGAIYGILLSFGLMHPNDRIMLLFPPIPMKAKYFVIIFGILELTLGIFNGRGTISDNVAHFAHLGGMLFGWLLLVYWKKRGKIYY